MLHRIDSRMISCTIYCFFLTRKSFSSCIGIETGVDSDEGSNGRSFDDDEGDGKDGIFNFLSLDTNA